jgi:pyruvate ferredoxin oxidoreductase alpha subunit
MQELLEGSQAVARAVSLARPDVVCAYPISPQTHIVEALAAMTRTGRLGSCEYINVESEFAALSVCIGSSAAGGRTYTATASQGLLYMAEALYNASGMSLPIVMTVASRAIGAPINIWNDHSDSLSQRDSGWLQLFAADNQEATDLHIQAFRIAEELAIPVMVCMDGFVLTHAMEVIDLPTQEQVDQFLPSHDSIHAQLDIDEPRTVGTMAGPEYFMETKYLSFQEQLKAKGVITAIGQEWQQLTGRPSGGIMRVYDVEDDGRLVARQAIAGQFRPAQDDEIVVFAMGSTLGTLAAIIPQLATEGIAIRLVGLTAFRPFPDELAREAVGTAHDIVVIDRAVQGGIGGVLTGEIRRCLRRREGSGAVPSAIHPVVAGLGGRPITEKSLAHLLRRVHRGEVGVEMEWLDLKTDMVEQALAEIEQANTTSQEATR